MLIGNDATAALLILAGAMILTLTERLRADVVALLVIVALAATGILTPQEALSGFSRPAVILIMSVFILAEGLRRAGVTERAGALLLWIAGTNERRLVAAVVVVSAGLSLFMNNLAAAALLLPAISGASKRSGVSPARLLMPLAFGTTLGGTATLLTTANIVARSLLRDEGLRGFGLFDFAPVGLPLLAAGTLYIVFLGRRWLPAEAPGDRAAEVVGPRQDLVEVYRLGERLFRARIPRGSALAGEPLSRSGFRERYSITVVALERGGQVTLSPAPDSILLEQDMLVLEGDVEEFRRRDVEPYFEILPQRDWRVRDLESEQTILVEVMLSPRSRLIGQTIKGSLFRQRYAMTALAIWRAGRQIRGDLGPETLQFGDALLLQGPRHRVPTLQADADLIVLADPPSPPEVAGTRRWVAAAIMTATLAMVAVKPDLAGEWMLGGALAMVLTGMLGMEEAYRAIEWRSVFLVAGMLPLGLALAKTGAAAGIAGLLLSALGPAGPIGVLGALIAVGILLTQGLGGPVVAAILTPIAIHAGQAAGINPRALVMAVALSASMAFMTPFGHPVNILVMGPGGYRIRDFAKVGVPLTVLLAVLILVLVPIFWPLAAAQ